MNYPRKSWNLAGCIAAFVLCACVVLPAYGQATSKLDAKTKARITKLIAMLSDDDVEMRRYAASFLIRLAPVAAKDNEASLLIYKAMVISLKDKDGSVRGLAACALYSLGSGAEQAIPDLIAALRDDAPSVRINAASALGRFGVAANEAVPDLITVMKVDEDELVRIYAANALDNISSALVDSLNHKDWQVRFATVRTLDANAKDPAVVRCVDEVRKRQAWRR